VSAITSYKRTRRIIFLQEQGMALSDTCCKRVVEELFEEESFHTKFIIENGYVRNNPRDLNRVIGKRGVIIILIIENRDGSFGIMRIDSGDGRVPREFKKRSKDTRFNSYQILAGMAKEVREQESLAKC